MANDNIDDTIFSIIHENCVKYVKVIIELTLTVFTNKS